ncbi:MAG TPA: hypothetical protein IGP91_00025 [Thermosynechococcus sp. M46_R2017_013]|nr:hypothetical protein [Thermosynechococcus sp. M46_R2017_013]
MLLEAPTVPTSPIALLHSLLELRREITKEGEARFQQWHSKIKRPEFIPSARNLAYYLALRWRDLRAIQMALMPWGLSSLGRIESRVLPNLDAVINTLGALCHTHEALPPRPPLDAFFAGDCQLRRQTEELFGPIRGKRHVRIMVTLPTEAGTDPQWSVALLRQGMNCARINCAHDDPATWEAMIGHLRVASQLTGQPCKILMDLGGPKPRIAEIAPAMVRLHRGDRLRLTRQICPEGSEIPQLTCSLPEILPQLEVGQRIWIDDGHIGGQIIHKDEQGVEFTVTHCKEGQRLKVAKGLNFPDSDLRLCPLTESDRQHLAFASCHADIIGYSFVQSAEDIALLQRELENYCGDRPMGIIAKIETPKAIRALPEMIIQAAGRQPFGVMIARGDLAVEIGYQRLAEMQEEILWLCEAAHVPVVWATQVLENLVKKGVPSRAEITDAAMAERAECVMLNKGPYVGLAVDILDDVLARMEAHQQKKTPQLRALHSWQPCETETVAIGRQ